MPNLDTRSAPANLASRDNIVPQGSQAGDPANAARAQYGIGKHTHFTREGTDASVGASAVVTVDTAPVGPDGVGALDTGNLPAGEYAIWATLHHPGAAAAGRSLILEYRNAGDSATVETLLTALAGAGKRSWKGKRSLAQDESIRVISGTDITNTNVVASLTVTKLPD